MIFGTLWRQKSQRSWGKSCSRLAQRLATVGDQGCALWSHHPTAAVGPARSPRWLAWAGPYAPGGVRCWPTSPPAASPTAATGTDAVPSQMTWRMIR